MKKKLAALLLALAMLFSLTGCLGNVYTKVMTIEGVEISSGLYLMMQMMAYSEAEGFMDDPDSGKVLSTKIDGQSAKSWIRATTEEYCRRYVAVKLLAREYDVKFSDDDWTNLESTLEYWTYFEDIYLPNGVGYDSWRYQVENSYLDDALFLALFSEGGALAHPLEETQAAYEAEYMHLRYLSIPLTAVSGEDEEEAPDVEDEITNMANYLLTLLEGGKSFEDIATEDLEAVYEAMNRSFEVESAADYVYTSYIGYDSEYYDESWLAEIKAADVGTMGVYKGEDATSVMLYEKIEMFEDEEQWAEQEYTVLNHLYTEEYDAWIEEVYNSYSLSKVPGAVWYFSPSKVQ